jgi:hypothetical protein
VPLAEHPATTDLGRRARILAAVQRIPGPMRLALGLLVLFTVAFALAILPLFITRGQLRAEIAGMQSSTAVRDRATTIDLGIDNVGDRLISPLCLMATFDAPVDVRNVVFQGLDTLPFRDGRACGGALSGGEEISAKLTFVPHATGTIKVRLVAAEGDREIGPVVTRDIEVSAQ